MTKIKYHKETFEKISEDKQQRVLNVAINEFAQKGFVAANINEIAKKAGISIGSLYNYFASKEDLFMGIIDVGYKLIESVISGIDLSEGDIFDKIEKLLKAAQDYSRMYPELTQIYLDISTEGLSHLSDKLSRKMENVSAKFYHFIITESQKQGLVNSELDPYVTAFCIDNLILMLQYSYTSRYFKERMKIFIGEDSLDEDERIIKGIMKFIRGAFSPAK